MCGERSPRECSLEIETFLFIYLFIVFILEGEQPFRRTAMTSSKDMKAGSVLQSSAEDRRRAPLDQLPPPANSNKPLTPFSIEDILNKPSVKKSVASLCPPRVLEKVSGSSALRNGITTPSSPLCALEELASKTFKGLEVSVIQAAEGKVD